MVAAEITTQAKLDDEKMVRGVVVRLRFFFHGRPFEFDGKGWSDLACEVWHRQTALGSFERSILWLLSWPLLPRPYGHV